MIPGEAVKPCVEWDENSEKQFYFSHGFNVRQRASRRLLQRFFFPSRQEKLLNKPPAGRQIVLQQQLQENWRNRNSDVEAFFQVKDIIDDWPLYLEKTVKALCTGIWVILK